MIGVQICELRQIHSGFPQNVFGGVGSFEDLDLDWE